MAPLNRKERAVLTLWKYRRATPGEDHMGLIGRWFSGTISMAAALIGAVLAMQAPALSEHYAAALFQREQELGQAIELSLRSARSVYSLEGQTQEQVVAFLVGQEPANASVIQSHLQRQESLRAAYDRIDGRSPASRPLALLNDYSGADPIAREVLNSALQTFSPEIQLSRTTALYAVIGIAIATFIVQLLLWPFGRLARKPAPAPVRTRRRY